MPAKRARPAFSGAARTACLALALAACGPAPAVLEFAAPALVFDQVDGGSLGQPSLVVGVVREGRFEALQSGQDLPIIHGFQGGRWVHLALRVTGMRQRGRAQLNLPGIGSAAYDVKLLRRGELLEIFDLPIPVGRDPRRNDEEVDALAGQPVRLEVSFTVGDQALSGGFDLVLSLAER